MKRPAAPRRRTGQSTLVTDVNLQQNTVEKQELTWEAWKAANAPEPPKPEARLHSRMSDAAATAIALLKLIDPAGWWNLVALDPKQKAPLIGKTFAPGSWDLIAAFVDSWNGKRNLYLTINEPLPHSRDDKLNEGEIANIRGLYIDVDPEQGIPFESARRDLDRDAQRAQSASLPPSVTLDSGGGNQMFWLLAAKVDARDGGRERARLQGRALHNVYGGDEVHSIEHIMRLPGTINIPTPSKRKAGRVERSAKILFQNDRRYTLEEFENGLAQPGPEHASGTETDEDIDLESARAIQCFEDLDPKLQTKFEKACKGSQRLAGIWRRDQQYMGAGPSRSEWRFWLAQELGRASAAFTAQEYVELVHAWPVVDNSHDLDLRQYKRDWGRGAEPTVKEREGWYEPLTDTDKSLADWPEPIDIFGDADPMELGEPPANSLPSVLEQFARSEARRKGVSMAFAASAALGVTAAAIGASLRVQVRQRDTGWTEPASLWLALVAEPGRAKSPTISEATRPLRELDTEHYRAFKVRHDLWSASAQAHKKRAGAPAPGPEPIMRRIAVDDITLEMQARIHADNPRGLLRTPDELMGFFGSFGAYKQKGDGDRTQMLRLFDGGSIIMDRVGAGSIRAEHALMGIVAGTQPEKIQKITRDLGADGMLQRFLFVIDDGAERRGLDEPPDQRAGDRYRAMLRTLASHDYPGSNLVRLSPEAHAVLTSAADAIDALKGLVGMPSAWRGHVAKWEKLLPRIVLTFHCVDQFSFMGQVDPGVPIDATTVECAANFARFLLRHSLAFYRASFDPDPASEDARAFAGYLLTRPDTSSITRRTLGQVSKDLREEPRRVNVMKSLIGVGWLRVAEQGADGPVRCDVNPRVHQRFAERASWERREREAKRAAIQNARTAKDWLLADSMSGNEGVFA